MNLLSALRRKRVLLPLLSLLVLAAAALIAVLRSAASRIVIYNQTGSPIVALKVEACGQFTVFRNLGDEDSYRWQLGPTGEPGDIRLETAAEPPWSWRGSYVQPRGGYRVILRLWPDGSVEVHTQISLWQRLLRAPSGPIE